MLFRSSESEAESLSTLELWDRTEGIVSRQTSIKTAGTNGNPLRQQTKAWQQYSELARELMP